MPPIMRQAMVPNQCRPENPFTRRDLIHAAQHFRDAFKSARLAARVEQARLAEEYRQQQEADAARKADEAVITGSG
jgi:hypothetical protein